ncbi:hypothetical protein CF086_17480 [Clostridium botulinum]|uniref:AAA family ATPase n=1 Tax=Clostridium botulinum TaxID=1491 RepID=UPI00077457CB|nr:AAA family ATPase [Clostridium botulinum]MBN3352090.1 hypothetical protein [Clostridium botulinum]
MSENIETGEIVSCEVKIKTKLYPKTETHKSDDWCILTGKVVQVLKGEPKVHEVFDTITIVGNLPKYNYTDTYKLVGKETYNEQYKSYQYEKMYFGKPMDLNNKKEQKIFLSHILTEKQFNNFYNTYENPFDVIRTEELEKITKVKGIGAKTAIKIIEDYKNTIDYSAIYVELDEYGLTQKMVEKLIEQYGSPNIVIDKIKENPYILITEVNGIGWSKADDMALKAGMPIDSEFRVQAFIQHILEEEAQKGNSYVSPIYLMELMYTELGEIDNETLSRIIQDMYKKKILWHNCDKESNKTTKVGLMKYYSLEKNICNELKRINNGINIFRFNNWETIIKETEQKQGWEYTDEQKTAIKEALKNQFIMITGGGGTGKTSVVNGIISVLYNYGFVQTALSGKAASRMAEVTGEEGYTIHRLLGYKKPHGFFYKKDNPIPKEIIIVDEISMLGGNLFYDLIKAIDTNSKLIVLGDIHQLESIGCMNLAKDILESKTLKSVELTKIHRQAQKSGIITSSMSIRNKIPLYEKGWIGHEIYGELKDFELEVYKNKDDSVNKCLEYFKKCLPLATDITEIQVLVPVKDRGEASVYNLNNKIQEIYNPSHNNNELQISLTKDKKFTIRENDKIMVIKNNYKIIDVTGRNTPIFNGQQGIVKSIDLDNEIIYVDMPYVSNELVIIPKKYWGSLILGYAMTVAKSQGSQYEYIIGCIDYSTPPMMLVKELVYTLITRASKYGVLLGETNALYKAMITSFVSTKQTFLKPMLDNEII